MDIVLLLFFYFGHILVSIFNPVWTKIVKNCCNITKGSAPATPCKSYSSIGLLVLLTCSAHAQFFCSKSLENTVKRFFYKAMKPYISYFVDKYGHSALVSL
jgi:hypothetical protein